MEKIVDNQYYDAAIEANMAVVLLKTRAFDLITSVPDSDELMEFIRDAEHNPKVKALMLLNEPDCLGEKVYDEFIRSILKSDQNSENSDVPAFLQKNTRFRQIINLNKLIRYLAGYQKLVVVGVSSTIVTPFMGVALVADLRLASPKGCFALAHTRYGLHPSGAIPFFLTHYLGHSKALEIQLSERVCAEEAFRMGIVNQILPSEEFYSNCIRFVQPYLQHCRSTLAMTKRLNNFKNRSLQEYLDHEASLMNL
ncbi:MAG TPA: enoyl-CoA hydratase/isomerase family protein [Bacteroidales bacterium]|nr:enoyl-CoA hydratase/isomerase family protein [Bacteroidales bacterium]